jgi:hypothetical protein
LKSDHSTRKENMKKLLELKYLLRCAVGFGLCQILTTAPAVAAGTEAELAQLRRATALFKRLEVAESAHYHTLPNLAHCIQNPGVGAMGYHYFNTALIDDVSPPDPLRPEGLVYAPGPNGQLQLAAVEWVVPSGPWHAAGNTAPPTVYGIPMHILNPALGWYILHAWVWKHNPAGMFEDWNPNVICP